MEILLKSERQGLYHIYQSLRRQLTEKRSLLVIGEILRIFVDTMTFKDKYSLLNRDNSTQPVQMQLSQKQFFFSEFSLQRFKPSLNLHIFKQKLTFVADVFPTLQTSKKVVRSMSKKSRFWGPLKQQDKKRAQTLFKFERQHLYHISWSLGGQLSCKNSLLVIWKS